MYYFIVLLAVTRLLFQTVPVLSAPSSVDNSDNSWPSGKFGDDLGVNIDLRNTTAVVAVRKNGSEFLKVKVDCVDGFIEDVMIGDEYLRRKLLQEHYPALDAYLKQENVIDAFPSGRLGLDFGVAIAISSLNNSAMVEVMKNHHPGFVTVRIDGDDGLIGDVLIGNKSFIGRPLSEYYPELAAYLEQKLFIRSSNSNLPPIKFGDGLNLEISSFFDDKTGLQEVVAQVVKEDGSNSKYVIVNSEDGLIIDVKTEDKSFIGKPLEEYYPALDAYLKQRYFIKNSSSEETQPSSSHLWISFLGVTVGLIVIIGIVLTVKSNSN